MFNFLSFNCPLTSLISLTVAMHSFSFSPFAFSSRHHFISPTSSCYSSSLSAHHLSFSLSISPPGSCSCMAPLRPPLPTPSAGQAVHGTCLSLDQAQSHPPGKPARVPVLPGPRPGLVRPATVHRRRLPSLHEGEAGITAALLHQGGEGAGEGNSGLLRPLSRSSPELPTHQ